MKDHEPAFLDLLRKRRSVRRFKKKRIDGATIERLKEACLRAPSSRNLNPWEFLFVTDQSTLEGLSEVKQHGSSFIKDSALSVVICADETRADTWVEDCSIAAIILQLTAEAFGLGSCWVQLRMRNSASGKSSEAVARTVLSLPEDKRVLCVVAMGYPDEKKSPLPHNALDWRKVTDVNSA